MNKRRILFLLGLLAWIGTAGAQTLTFSETTHNFGMVAEEKGSVTHLFPFTNTGDKPLVITAVHTDCGCTTPKYTLEAVAPGESGFVSVSFDPLYRPGEFIKEVRIFSNAGEEPFLLYIKGIVISLSEGKDKGLHIGDLYINSPRLNFGIVSTAQTSRLRFIVANKSEQPLEVTLSPQTDEITLSATRIALGDHEPMEVIAVAKGTPQTSYGLISRPIRVTAKRNGQIVGTGEIAISLPYVPDLDRSNSLAPQLELRTYIDLGIIPTDSTYKGIVRLKNIGQKPLLLYGVYPDTSLIEAEISQTCIAPGEEGVISYRIDTAKLAQTDEQRLTSDLSLLCNDPAGPLRKIRIMARTNQ